MGLALAQPQLEAITAACRRHQVAHMHAFGSVVRSDYRHGESDIDLLVEFQPCEPGTLYRTYFSLLRELRKSLSAPVDLVMVDAVRNPYIKATIEASKQEIYAAYPAARGRGSKMPDPGRWPAGERAHRMAQGRRGWLAGGAGDGPGVDDAPL